jgi:hypothetical protein
MEITLPCAANFKNSSGVGEYIKSFLAEARGKQKQEAVGKFELNFYFFFLALAGFHFH